MQGKSCFFLGLALAPAWSGQVGQGETRARPVGRACSNPSRLAPLTKLLKMDRAGRSAEASLSTKRLIPDQSGQ